MKRDDIRDEALGTLLREAADFAARKGTRPAEKSRPGTRIPDAAQGTVTAPVRYGRFPVRRSRSLVAAALAAGLVVALGVPGMVRRAADRELIRIAAGGLSRSLIQDSSSFLAELPTRSDLESAAEGWAGSLFPTDVDL